MNTSLPPKRRALASIDVNTRSPLAASRLSPSKAGLVKPKMALGTSRVDFSSVKRPIEQETDREAPGPAEKKRRLSGLGAASVSPRDETPTRKDSDNVTRPRSASPEDPSVFDSSTMDSSHVTTITEPEVENSATAPAPPPVTVESRHHRVTMTREEARRKAEILRLRLGLASYKVKTNQADVPLEKLQVRPLPGKVSKQTRSAVSLPSLPPLPAASPRRSSPISWREAERRFDSRARHKRISSPKLPTMALSHTMEPDTSVARTSADEMPVQKEESEQKRSASPAAPNKPQQRPIEQDEGLSDSERGGAAEGLLSLSQGSPGSGLK
ncbi:hypothetical protein F4861DRAFT_441754 [Xylaria intraflava]|nr:hypothetical protein F4861DRAFT_441754 [Xylaria intraflava]